VVVVTHQLNGRSVLLEVHPQVRQDEIVTLIEPKGMGKSTLLSIIAGVIKPVPGHVEINGLRRRASMANENVIRKFTTYLPTDRYLPASQSMRQWLWYLKGHQCDGA